jgi:hypothetical protein
MLNQASTKIQCELGGIAMIVNSKFTMNRGIIVRIEDSLGFMAWPEYDFVVRVWQVSVLCKDSSIYYYLPQKGELRQQQIGLVPDCYLRMITPKTGQLRFEFEGHHNPSQLEPMAL